MADGAATPLDTLIAVIGVLLPARVRSAVRRRIKVTHEGELSEADLETAVAALSDPRADRLVDGEVVVALLHAIDGVMCGDADVNPLLAEVVVHVERRWDKLVLSLANQAFNSYDRARIFAAFPQLQSEPVLISQTVAAVSGLRNDAMLDELLANLAPASIGESRLLIQALNELRRSNVRKADSLTTPLFAAIGRGLGWAPWVALQTLICARPDYADPQATFEQSGDRTKESHTAINARLEVAHAIEPLTKVREVAAILLQLLGTSASWGDDSLLSRPAEVRAAYVETLRAAIDGNLALRQAVIEALLWSADGRTADLAQFAAVAVSEADDHLWLIELETHPVQIVRYAARAIRAAKFAVPLIVPALPAGGGLAQSLAAVEGCSAVTGEPARTWLGDRAVEQLIERTIASVETRFARDYEWHGDEGEDRILSSLFTTLALRFNDLDHALEALARAASAPNRAAVTMRYRNVDRSEEGKGGIKGARSFSADLCLIVDPILDGTSLGRRVTLVQAKRLYRDHAAVIQPAWNSSFAINLDQRRALQKQTASSVYFFHGPPLGGRGVPVIPTQLVADLSEHQGSGAQLARATVATASRSLADWLTYDALALRVGDPYAELIEKAEGRPGSLARPLLGIPTVEVDVTITNRLEEH